MAKSKAKAVAPVEADDPEVVEAVEAEPVVEELELTDEEQSATIEKALADAKAKKNADAQAEKAAADAAAKDAEEMDPMKYIGLDDGRGGVNIVAAPRGWARDRTIRIGNDNYEHVGELPGRNAEEFPDDLHGRWTYRKM